MSKYNSRKFVMLNVCLGLSTLVPLLFQLLKIDTNVTMMSLGMIGGLSTAYFGVNLLDKKVEAPKGE